MKVSIIIPVYNAELYIRSCLESIINQKESDIEVICVDDGSTDESKKVIMQILQKHSCVDYIFQKKCGAPAARNNGLSRASGEFCIFLMRMIYCCREC